MPLELFLHCVALAAGFVTLWVGCLLALTSFLFLWFDTSLPKIVLVTIRRSGWRSTHQDFWPPKNFHTDKEWRTWLNVMAVEAKLPAWLVDLLGCPGCLSVHAAFWLGLLTLFLLPCTRHCLVWVIVCTATLPWLSNYLYARTHRRG